MNGKTDEDSGETDGLGGATDSVKIVKTSLLFDVGGSLTKDKIDTKGENKNGELGDNHGETQLSDFTDDISSSSLPDDDDEITGKENSDLLTEDEEKELDLDNYKNQDEVLISDVEDGNDEVILTEDECPVPDEIIGKVDDTTLSLEENDPLAQHENEDSEPTNDDDQTTIDKESVTADHSADSLGSHVLLDSFSAEDDRNKDGDAAVFSMEIDDSDHGVSVTEKINDQSNTDATQDVQTSGKADKSISPLPSPKNNTVEPIKKSTDDVTDGSELKSNEKVKLNEDSGSDVEIIEDAKVGIVKRDQGNVAEAEDKAKEDIVEETEVTTDSIDVTKTSGNAGEGSEDEDEDVPMIRMNSNIFEAQNDEDDDDDAEGMDPEAIQSMMQVEMDEEIPPEKGKNTKKQKKNQDAESPVRRNPRRHAAVVASNTIKEITNLEQETEREKDRDNEEDVEYISTVNSRPSSSGGKKDGERQRCHQCKLTAPSLIVVRQYGTDIHLCSNSCFNTFRNPDPTFRPLPCAKCGVLNRDTENTKLYFWETMNFCSDLCVGNFQLQIGYTCSTCSKKTPWTCMGKYCVRFGSDIRQFCTASCLETYKRNARVCFHCQLDIKRLGNVVLANIPSKANPKEFCSQDCVEHYIEQNITPAARKSPPMITCYICKDFKLLHKELVTAIMSYKCCSINCWEKLLDIQTIRTATKCETCTKFINMDTITISPSFYVASEKKAYGFCSATCKNVFVLKTRQIRPCTNCQVKKYNYDLIQYMGGKTNTFAVCSLNCLPKPSLYIVQLKAKLQDPSFVPPSVTTTSAGTSAVQQSAVSLSEAYAINNGDVSVVLNGGELGQQIQIEGVSSLADGSLMMMGDGTYQYDQNYPYNDGSAEYTIVDEDGVTLRQLTENDIIEIREAITGQSQGMADAETTSIVLQQGENGEGEYEEVALEDERWGGCEEIVIIRAPEPIPKRNKACQVRPIRVTQESQTDSVELADMPRIEPKVRVLIVPIPVLIPFPVYTCAQPVPVPFPIGIPVPIPILIDLSNKADNRRDRVSSVSSAISEISRIVEIEEEKVPIISEKPIDNEVTDEVEMMDTSEMSGIDEFPHTEQTLPTNSSIFSFQCSNSPMSVGSPSVPSSSNFLTASSSPAPGSPSIGRGRGSRAEYGIRAWKLYFGDEKDPGVLPPEALAEKLVDWTLRGTKPKGDRYEPDALLYFFLGIQQHLRAAGRSDQLFYETVYSAFVEAFTAFAEQEMSRGRCISKVDEDHVWEASELGPSTPGVLLFTLVYFVYKHFGIKTWEEHGALEFGQVQIHERYLEDGVKERYITIAGITNVDDELVEVPEESDTPHRCPVKLLEFYLTKCESAEGCLYKSIKPLEDPKSTWYSSEPLSQMDLYRMLVRAQMICYTSID